MVSWRLTSAVTGLGGPNLNIGACLFNSYPGSARVEATFCVVWTVMRHPVWCGGCSPMSGWRQRGSPRVFLSGRSLGIEGWSMRSGLRSCRRWLWSGGVPVRRGWENSRRGASPVHRLDPRMPSGSVQ